MKAKYFLSVLFTITLLNFFGFVSAQTLTVDSKDGVKVAYITKGVGEPALIFVHGWSCDKSYWENQLDEFAKSYKVVAVDLAGHGESGLNREDYTMEKFGEDVAAVVNQLKLNKVVLVGHSMGGTVIVEAAKILKEKTIGLVGVDTYQSFEDDWTKEQKEGILKPLTENFREAAKAFVKSMFPKTVDSLLVEKIANDMSSAPPQVAVSAMRNLFYYDLIPVWKEVNLPLVSINCDLYPVSIEANKKYVSDYDVKIMKGVGHFIQLENPAEFNKLLHEAVTQLTQK